MLKPYVESKKDYFVRFLKDKAYFFKIVEKNLTCKILEEENLFCETIVQKKLSCTILERKSFILYDLSNFLIKILQDVLSCKNVLIFSRLEQCIFTTKKQK